MHGATVTVWEVLFWKTKAGLRVAAREVWSRWNEIAVLQITTYKTEQCNGSFNVSEACLNDHPWDECYTDNTVTKV